MNTFDQDHNVLAQSADARPVRKNGLKWLGQILFTLITLTVLLFAQPEISSAGGECSTTTGDCDASISLYVG
jgi:hypothetical protein